MDQEKHVPYRQKLCLRRSDSQISTYPFQNVKAVVPKLCYVSPQDLLFLITVYKK